jgi:hypothetical protein
MLMLSRPSSVFVSLLLLVCGGCAASNDDDANEPSAAQADALVSASRPTNIAADIETELPLRINATHVYFFDWRAKAIRRVAKTGGAIETVGSTLGAAVADFVLDSNNVWALINRSSSFGELLRIPVNGGASVVHAGGDIGYGHIAADLGGGGDLYIAANDRLWRFPKSGMAISGEDLGDAPNASAIALDASTVYWADMGPGNPAIGCNRGDGRIMSKAKSGVAGSLAAAAAAPRVLASFEDCPVSLALDGSSIYWRSFFGPVRKGSTFGGLTSTVENGSTTNALAASGSAVFVATNHLKSVKRTAFGFPHSTDYVATRVEDPSAILSVALDATHAYYIVYNPDSDKAQIMKVAR